jgi:glutamine amidotransferase
MIAIIDYRAGNLTSVKLAFETLNIDAQITDQPDCIISAERVVFPGVGAAAASMRTLHELGLVSAIKNVIERNVPFLGICMGTQVAFNRSEEDGGIDCIGILPGTVRLFAPTDRFDKVPQMGWNSVCFCRNHPVFDGIEDNSEFYFVHSYDRGNPLQTLAPVFFTAPGFAAEFPIIFHGD